MQRLFAAAVVSFALVALSAAPAPAWFFHQPCKQCDKCGTFYVRPYNAFSPVAFGNITFAGYTMPGNGYGGYPGGGACDGGAPTQLPAATDVNPGAPLPSTETPAETPASSSQAPAPMPAVRMIQNTLYRPVYNIKNGPMVPMVDMPPQFGGP
jgi:hypothetical protein